jgi:hypothetical protein
MHHAHTKSPSPRIRTADPAERLAARFTALLAETDAIHANQGAEAALAHIRNHTSQILHKSIIRYGAVIRASTQGGAKP